MPVETTDARQRVLGVASRLFGERGYGGTSLQAISDHLGFTKAALYYHFPAKNDILAALADPVADRLETIAGDYPDVSRPSGRRAMLGAYLEALVEAGVLAAVLMADPTASGHPDARRCRSARTQLRDLLAGAGSPPIGAIRATCSLGALYATVIDFPDAEPARSRPTILAASVRALGDRPPRESVPT
jgi:AcrR family transcriptional regulator